MDNGVRAHAIISGRVQGVCFRLETRDAANIHGVLGWVKNLPDGRVEAVFEGDKEAVESVLKWCHQGPPISKVNSVEVEWEDYTGRFERFDITY